MNKTTPAFSLRESNIYKGIAVILMLFHHLFADPNDYKMFMNQLIFSPLTGERVKFLAILSKICVAIFVFISGYGMAVSYKKKFNQRHPEAKELGAFIWLRYWKLMTAYWFIFLLSLVTQPLGRTMTEVYGKNIKNFLVYMIIDFFGFSYIFATPTMNATWWYVGLAIIFIILVPILLRCMQTLGTLPVTFAVFALLLLTNTNTLYTSYLYSLLLGIVASQLQLFEKITSQKPKRYVFTLLVSAVCFLFLMSIRTNFALNGITDGLITFTLAILVCGLITKIKIIAPVLRYFGQHSGNIFMLHTFLYYYYFKEFFYSLRHWIVILAALLLISLILSIAIEWIKKKTGYLTLMQKLGLCLQNIFSI